MDTKSSMLTFMYYYTDWLIAKFAIFHATRDTLYVYLRRSL